MNARFVNAYDITDKIYLYWATHPVGKTARRRSYAMWSMYILEFALAVALIVMGLLRIDPVFVIIGAAVAVYVPVKVFYLDRRKYLRQFRLLLGRKGLPVWHRELTFTDEAIELNDAGSEQTLKYSQIVDATDVGDWFCLWLDPSSAYRVSKTGFTTGKSEDFLAFMQGKLAKKK